jgi:phosphate starvation-inducible PhoH-like protein
MATSKTDAGDVREQIEFEEAEVARYVYGRRDAHLRVIEKSLEVEIGARGTAATVSGAAGDVALAASVLRQLYRLAGRGYQLGSSDVRRAVDIVARDPDVDLVDIFGDTVFMSVRNRAITPKGPNQKLYVDAMRRHDIVFGIGPAGTGKTYLAMAMALSAFFDKKVKRIILTRPAVEAGEKLGFLPGDLAEKVNPYLRPLHDAIYDMLEGDRASALLEEGAVEVAPLAFMRGRTLNDSFIILDEAQNTTQEQMKMFLTRIGFGSKAVVTGDVTQTDLPGLGRSGLVQAERILRGIPGISFCEFTEVDVVRHPLVQKIILAYEASSSE